MSARNKPEAKAERREERTERDLQAEFMAAVAFAVQAARATAAVPMDTIKDAIAYGEKLVQPGVSVDDALEIEHGLRALRAVLVYRQALEGHVRTLV